MGGTIGSIEIRKRVGLPVVAERMKLPVVTRTIVGEDVVYVAGSVRLQELELRWISVLEKTHYNS